jgi:ABC-type arginine/histidine transport system permease subunit
LAILLPGRFLAFQEKTTKSLGIPAAADNNSVNVVFRAFWMSLVLVLVSALVGAVLGVFFGLVIGTVSSRIISWLQIAGASVLLWGTLFVRGWEIQTFKGQTLIERVNRWIYRALYCVGTAVLVSSLTWTQV